MTTPSLRAIDERTDATLSRSPSIAPTHFAPTPLEKRALRPYH